MTEWRFVANITASRYQAADFAPMRPMLVNVTTPHEERDREESKSF
jgi:hypothetical protein